MLLLDTHTLLWFWQGNDEELGNQARKDIEEAWLEGEAAVSAISFWEIAMLVERGRFKLGIEVPFLHSQLVRHGLVVLDLDIATVMASVTLKWKHKDPADRFIVAAAMPGYRLVTADSRILHCPLTFARQNARI